jgi:hypothetical protein
MIAVGICINGMKTGMVDGEPAVGVCPSRAS